MSRWSSAVNAAGNGKRVPVSSWISASNSTHLMYPSGQLAGPKDPVLVVMMFPAWSVIAISSPVGPPYCVEALLHGEEPGRVLGRQQQSADRPAAAVDDVHPDDLPDGRLRRDAEQDRGRLLGSGREGAIQDQRASLELPAQAARGVQGQLG